MTSIPPNPEQNSQRWLLATVSAAAAAAGIAAIWAALSVALHATLAWMALLAAFDIIVVLALTGVARGWRRAALAGSATVLSLALSWWFIAAAQMARTMGLHPFVSLQRMGAGLALDLVRASHTYADVGAATLGVFLALGWGLAGVPGVLSGRRPAP